MSRLRGSLADLLGWRWATAVLVLALIVGAVEQGFLDLDSDAAADPTEEKTPKPPPPAASEQSPRFSDPKDFPAPPPWYHSLFDKSGYLETVEWDDRNLPEAVKQANPWINARWVPFNRCLVARGFGIPGKAILLQADIDAIAADLNSDGPFLDGRTRAIWKLTPGLEAFIACTETTLLVDDDGLPGILQPGDPDGQPPQ